MEIKYDGTIFLNNEDILELATEYDMETEVEYDYWEENYHA